MRKLFGSRGSSFAIAPLLLVAGLAACADDEMASPAPTPSPSVTLPPPTVGFNVNPCLNQVIPGTGGVTVAGAVVPDTLTVNLAAASGFPNGRRLPDPVIDVTLAIIFLDLSVHSPLTFASIPLNPGANDRAYRGSFPFLAAPQGAPPIAPSNGSGFTFNTAPSDQFVRVDRAGMPAVATALIGSSLKNPYNDANPSDDVAGTFVPELAAQLTNLTNALADDLTALGLTPCADAI